MEERLHDPRLMILPQPIRIDAVAGEPVDTALFNHLGIMATLRPYLTDAGAPTEWIINHAPGIQRLAMDHFGILGGANMGSFMLTMSRARLRAYGDPIFEVSAPLQTMLAQTDLQEGLPTLFFRSPKTMLYLALARPNPLRVPHRLSGLHECEGAYISMYQLPPHHQVHQWPGRARALRLDPAQPTRAIEIVITGSPVGKANALDDASQDFLLLIQNEDECLSAVLERHIAFFNSPAAYSQPGMAPINSDEVVMITPVVNELAKVLLYLNLPDAEQTPLPERSDLERRLSRLGSKLSAKRRERLARTYDRVLIGPREMMQTPEAEGTETSTTRTMRPHWRRGHFRRIRYGEAFSDVRIGWIRPALVGAADLVNIAKFRPVDDDVDTGQSD